MKPLSQTEIQDKLVALRHDAKTIGGLTANEKQLLTRLEQLEARSRAQAELDNGSFWKRFED